MLWTPWTQSNLIPVLLFTTTALAWWTSPENTRLNLIAACGILIFSFAVAPEFSQTVSTWIYLFLLNATASSRLDLALWVAKRWKMLVTGAAVIWLGRRAWQTLWKPVPELINILGVEVPDSPYVVLAGIRSDAATLNWTRPAANRPVQKFLIQVNGVNVGEVGPNQEPAIVVSGLKPDHFYNVRVIAVGSNNFQAGSQVVRLRTYGKDGRPRLGNGRLPPHFREDEQHEGTWPGEHGQDHGGSRNFPPVWETAGGTENGTPMAREGSVSSGSGPRRNTVTRKRCPSTTSDHQAFRDEVSRSEQSLMQLTEEFEKARRETEETMVLISKEDIDNERLVEELEKEKMERKKEREKKDAQTDKLRREVNSTDREMRKAQNKKAALEKRVKEKLDERAKMDDSISALERKIVESRSNMDSFEQRKTDAEEERDGKVECLGESLRLLLDECAQMEAELKDKRDKVKELEDTRKKLPGGEDDAETREKDADLKRHWTLKQRFQQDQLHRLHQTSKELDEQVRVLVHQGQHVPAKYELYSQLGSAGLDVDHHTLMHLKRQSRASNTASNVSVSSPLPPYSQIDPATLPTVHGGFASSRAAHGQGFAQGPFMDLSTEIAGNLNEGGLRTSSAPLSPSAAALLPSNMLDEFDEGGSGMRDVFAQQGNVFPANDDPQSPGSSTRSMSVLSSARESSCSNLHYSSLTGDSSEAMSMQGSMSQPRQADATHRLADLFAHFQRARVPKGAVEEGGPALGSLKHGQSNSFPRQTDETEVTKRKWTVFRSSTGPDVLEQLAPTSQPFKGLIPFRSPRVNKLFSDRDPSSPRPASIASSELPRPSTDSSSIWGPPDAPSNRFWPPDAWSRAPSSRRPSMHGSPAALKTTLASDTDEILQDEFQPDASQVGVIGSRLPAAAKASFGRLNPDAPAFRSFFKSKDGKEVAAKEKDSRKGKDRARDKGKEKPKSNARPETRFELDSPEDLVHSRDSFSISESYDSLSLDRTVSSTPSEPVAMRDEGVVRKLFRKGSSSKFSLPGRLKKGGAGAVSGASLDRSSMGDEDVFGDDNSSPGIFLARSYDSMASSPGLGHSNASSIKGSKEGGAKSSSSSSVRWLSNFSKKSRKEKESLEMDRERPSFSLSEVDGALVERIA